MKNLNAKHMTISNPTQDDTVMDDDYNAYRATTHDIEIIVETTFLEQQSSPEDDHFVWAYHIKMINHGKKTVQLHARHWRLSDANGMIQEVRGAGVVGEYPILNPKESYEYTSGTPLGTNSGIMDGHYVFSDGYNDKNEPTLDSDKTFNVTIPAFPLEIPENGAVNSYKIFH